MIKTPLTFLFLLLATPSWAAVAFVEVDNQDCDNLSVCTESSHTAGGAGTITLVFQASEDSIATDRDTAGCTMAGNAMTRTADNDIIATNTEADLYYTIAGTPGDIVCTWAGTVTAGSMMVSTYSGIETGSQPDAIAEDSDTANTVIQQGILTVSANDMIVDFVANSIGSTSFTPDGSQIERLDVPNGGVTVSTSDLLVTTATTYTQGQTAVDSGALVYKIIAIDPSTGRRRTAVTVG